MGITLGVILPLIILPLIVAGIHLFNKRRQTQGTSQRETAVERGEGDALMNTETKCLAENEQNQQLIEKDEGTSTEDKESSPFLAENKNENQSEGQLEENSMKNERISVSQNYDSPQKNESFETPLTSPAVQTEPDTNILRTENKDDKKTEKKEGEGSREGHDSSEEVAPGAGEEKKTEEGSIEGDPSVVEVLPDDGVKDDSNSSGDTGKQKTEVTEEDQSERTGNEDLHANGSSGEQNSEQEDVSVDTTQNSDSQSDEGSGTSDNVSVTYVNEEEQEHPSKTIDTNLNSSAGSGGGQDENASDEIKDAVGIFVDSLESITREDDGEGGWSELQELLDYMCTGPARKILFDVVKMYVDNPDSYFHDESKKASVKSVLPPEYHSAIDPDSESKKSIPVMYAILQLSLGEEHRPKSGWGQMVNDTDTGVGDDVERVYKVHTLSREIQNPEEISVDGYIRLLEMFIDAVNRLDVRGKYSEDYREIVRRWENIQRKQWVKDKWTTFTNFVQKWS
ncbi:neurofilament medium polypeptide-like isoform X1 [Ostrea edulis]|uniref:neurofilament medium polypeptide-like isoform X1 n=1 Tax=Ostrea edulis TaxID=37623 RepID=UPI0024AF5DEA|nr:neurofilament medium polypeptide-like isoform X1 [Ostrea edulis]